VIVDEAEGRINHLIEIESELFSLKFLIKFTSNIGFQLFLDVLINFAPEKDRSDLIVI